MDDCTNDAVSQFDDCLIVYRPLLQCILAGHEWEREPFGDKVCRRCGNRLSEVDENGWPKPKTMIG